MQEKKFRVLVINPGIASTKIGVFEDDTCLLEKDIFHPPNATQAFQKLTDQDQYRKNLILETLDYEGINISKLDAVCGRGGLLKPIEGGTYLVNEEMLEDLFSGYNGEHPSNLGGILAHEIAIGLNIPSYIVDPVVVDEMKEIAKISGIPELPRKSIFHALNQKAVARRVAKEMGEKYEHVNFVVAHLGEGITVGAHKKGRVVDVNNGIYGDGPFTLERAGTVPTGDLIAMCYSGKYLYDEMMNKIVGQSGLKSYLHFDNTLEIENRIRNGESEAKLVYEAMAYQIAKEIGSMSVVLEGDVDGIILTGNLANGEHLTTFIKRKVSWIADVLIYPGENKLQALAEGTLRVLRMEEEVKSYPYTKVE